jgi:hypothetical protein
MDTVRGPISQLSIRSSNGYAASARNSIGFDSALARRGEPGLPRFPARMFAFRVAQASTTFAIVRIAARAPDPRFLTSA